jgi:altronate dehydratase large subunit
METFRGYENTNDESVGTRNYLAVIPTVFCANEVAAAIAREHPMCRPLLHNKGCGQLKPDNDIITRTLVGLGLNPNVGAVILVSLGCEAISVEKVYQEIATRNKWVDKITIQDIGGMENAVTRGREIVRKMAPELERRKRKEFPFSRIALAVKCGSSDATSGISANPATGKAVDYFLQKGAKVVFGETTEYLGAEHILAKRAVSEDVREKLLSIVDRMENRIIQMGVDMRGTQPSPGNIAGGLTTIEEKSLGAISKSGSNPINDVHEYGESVETSGLHVMDSPGKEDEFLTGIAAAGANICIFTTGGGAPQGFPLLPVVKVAGNPDKINLMRDHVDVDAGCIITGRSTINQVSERIVECVCQAASGNKTAAERQGYDLTVGIYTLGPTV